MINLLLDIAPSPKGNDAVVILAVLAAVVGFILLLLAGIATAIFFLVRRRRQSADQLLNTRQTLNSLAGQPNASN